jgi:hypothetical protein
MMLRVAFSRKISSSMTLLQLKSLLPFQALLLPAPLQILLRLPLRLLPQPPPRPPLLPLLEKHACVTPDLSYFHV